MTKRYWVCCLIISFLFGSGSALASKTGAHVHGVATLQVVQDGNVVSISLESPLDNLIGFEHAPRTDKQKQAVQAMVAKLHNSETLFAFSAAAQCKPGAVQLIAPVLGVGRSDTSASSKPHDYGQHASLDAEISFTCANPSALKDLEVKLFDEFPKLRQLDTQMVGPKGQSAAKLTSKQRRIVWR